MEPGTASDTRAKRAIDPYTLALLIAMYGLLIGNWALYRTAPLPLPFHVALSVLGIHLAFTIWHEGVHRNSARAGWINDAIGIVGIFPYMTPYYLQQWVHLQHHARLNQPDDPNSIYVDGPFWTLPLRYPRIVLFLRDRVGRDPRSRGRRIADVIPLSLVIGLYAFAWSRGMLLDLVLLWALPVVIAKVVMDWYINYLPHVGLPPDRYRGTRVIDVPWFTPLVLGHNYHAIHHLWPGLPWHSYRETFRQRRASLEERGVPIETRLVGYAPGRDELARRHSLPG